MARHLPPLNAVRAFEAAARHASVSRAAEELNVTHSAVSRQVRQLEARLGVRLLARKGRGLALTDEGLGYLAAVRDVFDRLDAATAELTRRRNRQTLVVHASPTFAIRWLIPRLPSFRGRHPEIEVRLTTDVETAEFDPSDCDVALHCYDLHDMERLIRRRAEWRHLRFEKFLEEVMFPVVSPKLLASGPKLRKPADVLRHTLLHSRSGLDAWGQWFMAAGLEDRDVATGLRFDHFHFALQAAAQGLGIAMGTRPCAGDDLAAGTLVAPFPDIVARPSHYYFIYPESLAGTPKVAVFREWLFEVAPAAADLAAQAAPEPVIRRRAGRVR